MSILNFNIGVLGHVDSGKTSLAKALSTIASTACFDKNPQSKERGITLDLGFSSFTVDAPENIKAQGYSSIQYTLVDCPGHASLIRTIIGGAQIIDMMLLVIDIVKGVQTQTAECLIIGEITCDKMLIVLNKLDLIEESKRQSTIEKMIKRLHKTLENTKFANSHVVALAANPGSVVNKDETSPASAVEEIVHTNSFGVDSLINKLKELTFVPKRSSSGSFLFAIDHCFNVKGQGTVMTGTVLNGQVKVNDNIELPALKVQKKVKSMQMFKKPIEQAIQGDRLGICVTNFDAKLIERGIACTPDYVKSVYGVIIKLNKIRYYKGAIENGARFHISIGHETMLAKVELFGELETAASNQDTIDLKKEYIYVHEVKGDEKGSGEQTSEDTASKDAKANVSSYYVLIDFTEINNEHPVLCAPKSLVIGSKLDTDINLNQCRIAFYGHVLHAFTNKDYRTNGELGELKVFKEKMKEGSVERMSDAYTLIGRSLFKKETNIDLFKGLKVTLSTGEQGVIEGSFGQSGKFKIRIPNGLTKETQEMLSEKQQKKKGATANQETSGENSTTTAAPIKVYLNFKKYVHDHNKKMIQ